MADANDIVIEALLDDVLDRSMLTDAVDEALTLLRGGRQSDRLERVEAQIAQLGQERARLIGAIAAGGQLAGLVEALREREQKEQGLEAERQAIRSERGLRASDVARVRVNCWSWPTRGGESSRTMRRMRGRS
jgi:hypothetical protein